MYWFLLHYLCSGLLFPYSDEEQPIKRQLPTGTHFFDLWGADGGAFLNQDNYRGKGAFLSAKITSPALNLHFFIGQSPPSYLVFSESTKQYYCLGGNQFGGNSSSSQQVPGFFGTGGGGLTGFSMSDNFNHPLMSAGSGGGSTLTFPGSPGGRLDECVTHSSDSQPANPSFTTNACTETTNGGTGSTSFFANYQYYSNAGGGAGYRGGQGGHATRSSDTYQFAGDGGRSFIDFQMFNDFKFEVTHVITFRGNEIPNIPLFHKESHHGQIKVSKVVDCSKGFLEGCPDGEDCYCETCSPHCYRCDPQTCLYCEPPYQLIEGECEIFSESFSKSQDFTESFEFFQSYIFTETAGFSQTFDFTNSLGFSHSSSFTKTEVFTPTVSFSKSFDFSQSCSFTPTDNFSQSLTFTKSSDFSHSSPFTATGGFSQTANFSTSLTFSLQNAADSNSNNNNIPLIAGSVVGLVVVAIIIFVVVLIVVRRKTTSQSSYDMQETVISMDTDEAKNDFSSHDNNLINSENPYDLFMIENMQLQE